MASIGTLTQTLNQMADGLQGISGGLKKLNTGFQAAYQALDQAIMSIPDPTLSQEQINELYALVAVEDPSQNSTLDALVKAYSSAATVKGTYQNVKPGFDAVGTTITNLSPSLGQMEGGLREIATQIDTALSSGDLSSQIGQLATGLSQLSDNYVTFHNGLVSYMGGVKQLSKGYIDFQNGMSQYSDGMQTFQNGISKLHDGTTELQDSTDDLPTQIQDKIDTMMAEYTGKDFKPVSFLSDKNNNVRLVQFVMKTVDILLPEQEEVAVVDQPKETFWDRLLQLFTGK
jgi:X-X-X-Leu-X-X-Gly heptad repeat protein